MNEMCFLKINSSVALVILWTNYNNSTPLHSISFASTRYWTKSLCNELHSRATFRLSFWFCSFSLLPPALPPFLPSFLSFFGKVTQLHRLDRNLQSHLSLLQFRDYRQIWNTTPSFPSFFALVNTKFITLVILRI